MLLNGVIDELCCKRNIPEDEENINNDNINDDHSVIYDHSHMQKQHIHTDTNTHS